MGPLAAIGLGTLQGVTEFLPVSSSGHLVLAQSLLTEFQQPGVLFDALVHVGTMTAVLAYLGRHEEFARGVLEKWRRWASLLVIGTVPAALTGLLLRQEIASLFVTVAPVGGALILTGAVLLVSESVGRSGGRQEVHGLDALLIGGAQAVALVPGVSRSGATIATGLLLGLQRDTATLFSLLLAVPVMAGAGVVELIAEGLGSSGGIPWYGYGLGVTTAAVVGYVAVGWVFSVVRARRLRAFGVYCVFVGLTTLVAARAGWVGTP